MKKKNPKLQLELMSNPDLERSIENLADVVIENLKSSPSHEYEPFEAYAQKVRMHIYENIHEFRLHFVHGYEVLLEEIMNEQNKSKP